MAEAEISKKQRIHGCFTPSSVTDLELSKPKDEHVERDDGAVIITPTFEIVARTGDLFVRVGQNDSAICFQVSSTVLILISPVFEEMLGPSFVENRTKYSKESPLSLPEDKVSAFRAFFTYAHFHTFGTGFSKLETYIDLTVLCHKYRCVDALKTPFAWNLCNIRAISPNQLETATLRKHGLTVTDTMLIAYIIGDDELFRLASKAVIFDEESISPQGSSPELLNILQDNPFHVLMRLRYDWTSGIIHECRALLNPFYERKQKCGRCIGKCHCLHRAIGFFHALLFDAGLEPSQDYAARPHPSQLFSKLGDISRDFSNATEHSPIQRESISVGIRNLERKKRSTTDGACLKCAKARSRAWATKCESHYQKK